MLTNRLEGVERLVAEAKAEELPALLGELGRLHSLVLARLASTANDGRQTAEAQQADELLDAKKAARRLGVSEDFCYRNKELPFRVQVGRRVRFSARGIERYIRLRQGG